MKIGVPKEIKVHEYRVGLVPAGVKRAHPGGHQVLVQRVLERASAAATMTIGRAGATIAKGAEAIFADCDMIVKVKEPQLAECPHAARGSGAVHLSAPGRRSRAGGGADVIGRHRDRLRDRHRTGRLAAAADPDERSRRAHVDPGRGASYLQKANGGCGVLLGGVPGVAPAKVVVIGGGVAGTHAAEMAVGLRADVTVVDRSVRRLRELSAIFGSRCRPSIRPPHAIERAGS